MPFEIDKPCQFFIIRIRRVNSLYELNTLIYNDAAYVTFALIDPLFLHYLRAR